MSRPLFLFFFFSFLALQGVKLHQWSRETAEERERRERKRESGLCLHSTSTLLYDILHQKNARNREEDAYFFS